MTLLETITHDITDAMKLSDKFRLSVLRMLKSALQLESINKKSDLTEEEVIAVIRKQVKVRIASKEEFLKYDRLDSAESLDKEIEILSTYLPKEMNADELNKILDDVFNEINPSSMKDMGKVMARATEIVAGRTDMSTVSTLVKERIIKL